MKGYLIEGGFKVKHNLESSDLLLKALCWLSFIDWLVYQLHPLVHGPLIQNLINWCFTIDFAPHGPYFHEMQISCQHPFQPANILQRLEMKTHHHQNFMFSHFPLIPPFCPPFFYNFIFHSIPAPPLFVAASVSTFICLPRPYRPTPLASPLTLEWRESWRKWDCLWCLTLGAEQACFPSDDRPSITSQLFRCSPTATWLHQRAI